LARVGPAEVLFGPRVSDATVEALDTDAATTRVGSAEGDNDTITRESGDSGTDTETATFDAAAFRPERADERLSQYTTADRFERAERVAVGGLLAYAEYTQGASGPLSYVQRVRRYDPRQSLRLDATALRGLELFEAHTPSGETLLETVDETRSALGRRRLESWLRRPLVDRERIERRHDAVEALAGVALVRAAVREQFDAAYDLERLVSSVARERADARDLRSLHATLAVVPELRDATDGVDALADVREALDPLPELRTYLDDALVVDPPQEITEGGVIREGFDEKLDELRETAREGREWVADLEASERERTGIDNLSVGYNEVHGYYIEVTNSHLGEVPDDYTRRQTLKNSERFYTPELKRREDEILGAEERADSREYELFTQVRERVADETERLQALADALARLDALAGLATVAVDRDYTRPEIRPSPSDVGRLGTMADEPETRADEPETRADESEVTLDIERGRHPVVEQTESEFVPNDATLPHGSVTVLTGPNMSGKSTYMRQIALAVVLAQAGSFVPADAAALPVLDRVFTRVGASDDIAGGQSTFMREMAELTTILNDATADSLVLLDEVGRGTSTADGMAIARAAVEFLHDELGATTVFATHYHDLTGLADRLDRVRNRHFAATRTDGDVTFLHRVREGAASSSYGVEVAEMAGVPPAVVDRARELVGASSSTNERDGDHGAAVDGSSTRGAVDGSSTRGAVDGSSARGAVDGSQSSAAIDESQDGQPADTDGQRTLAELRGFEGSDDPAKRAGDREDHRTPSGNEHGEAVPRDVRELLAEIRDVSVAETTPLEALQTLHDLQQRAEEWSDE
jgi:DNA mismatch repair protein MutS